LIWLFAGLLIEEAAEALGVSRVTAFLEWTYARSSWMGVSNGRTATASSNAASTSVQRIRTIQALARAVGSGPKRIRSSD
jgi:hypothetical protein